MVRSATSTAGKKESSSELNSQSIHRLLTLAFEQDRDESQAAHHLSMQAWIGIASLRFAFSTMLKLLCVGVASGFLLVFLLRAAHSTAILGGWLALLVIVAPACRID